MEAPTDTRRFRDSGPVLDGLSDSIRPMYEIRAALAQGARVFGEPGPHSTNNDPERLRVLR